MVVEIKDDFDLTKIAESGQCFRWFRQESGAYRIIAGDRAIRIRKMDSCKYEISCSLADFNDTWRRYFDLDNSYEAVREQITPQRDAFLYEAAEYGNGIRILFQDPWEMIISFLISQRKSIPAIRTSIDRLCRAAGRVIPREELLFDSEKELKITEEVSEEAYTFPTAWEICRLGRNGLDECGLGYRTEYVYRVAKAVADGAFDIEALSGLDDETLFNELLKLYGVGPKVANCVRLFGFHRLDAFPRDVWINKVVENEYGGDYPYERYRPFNGVMQQYMFFYYRDQKK